MRESLVALLLIGGCSKKPRPLSYVQDYHRACSFPELVLTLPFHGERVVIQGNDGAWEHVGNARYAWDFFMPEGTVVIAAADGLVVEVTDQFSEGGLDRRLADSANHIILDHGRSRYSIYGHLQFHGTRVRPGEFVTRGTILGLSGSTGYSSGPHLHFAVVDERSRSLPVCFADVPGGVPVTGRTYRAGEAPQSISSMAEDIPSVPPLNVFEENGVLLETPLPGRRITGSFEVRGRALRQAAQASVGLWPRGQERGIFFETVLNYDGRFTILVDVNQLANHGQRFDLIVGLRTSSGRLHLDFSLPVFLDVSDLSNNRLIVSSLVFNETN